MERRSDLLIQELKDLLGTDEVYFQPSAGVDQSDDEQIIFTGMNFPCFVLKRTTAYQPKANDRTYLFRPGYELTYINQDEPDPEILEQIGRKFGNCVYQRHFVADNLHHDVFVIYF